MYHRRDLLGRPDNPLKNSGKSYFYDQGARWTLILFPFNYWMTTKSSNT
jgi:hypothetical protein